LEISTGGNLYRLRRTLSYRLLEDQRRQARRQCHKGAGVATSGIDLGDYAHFKIHVDNGDVRSAITHDGRKTPMPYQRAQLPSCEIETILAWINAGAQNN
jgi:hypothetical protein